MMGMSFPHRAHLASRVAGAGRNGDGKVLVRDLGLDRVVRIRTGELDADAL